jgi:hypothetical protein
MTKTKIFTTRHWRQGPISSRKKKILMINFCRRNQTSKGKWKKCMPRLNKCSLSRSREIVILSRAYPRRARLMSSIGKFRILGNNLRRRLI